MGKSRARIAVRSTRLSQVRIVSGLARIRTGSGVSLSLSLSVANPHAKRAPLHSFGVQQAGTPPSSRTPSASARTRWSDEDAMQVLNRAVYLTLLEEPRWGYFHQLGLVGGRSTGTSPSSRPAASPRSLRHRSSTLRRAPPRG